MISSRVIQISGTGRQWRLFTDNLGTEKYADGQAKDALTVLAQNFLAGGWLSMRQYAVLDGQVSPKPAGLDWKDGEWLNAALFGRMAPKSTRGEGLTTVQCLNLGWQPNPFDGLPVIGAYTHLAGASKFKTYFLQGLGDHGYFPIAPPGKMTIGSWQALIHNDRTIAPDDKIYLWRIFVVTAMADGTLGAPPSVNGLALPLLTPAQRQTYTKFREGRDKLEFSVPMYFLPVFTFVTNVLGAAFPAP